MLSISPAHYITLEKRVRKQQILLSQVSSLDNEKMVIILRTKR